MSNVPHSQQKAKHVALLLSPKFFKVLVSSHCDVVNCYLLIVSASDTMIHQFFQAMHALSAKRACLRPSLSLCGLHKHIPIGPTAGQTQFLCLSKVFKDAFDVKIVFRLYDFSLICEDLSKMRPRFVFTLRVLKK